MKQKENIIYYKNSDSTEIHTECQHVLETINPIDKTTNEKIVAIGTSWSGGRPTDLVEIQQEEFEKIKLSKTKTLEELLTIKQKEVSTEKRKI